MHGIGFLVELQALTLLFGHTGIETKRNRGICNAGRLLLQHVQGYGHLWSDMVSREDQIGPPVLSGWSF